MKRLMFSVAAAALGLVFVSASSAHGQQVRGKSQVGSVRSQGGSVKSQAGFAKSKGSYGGYGNGGYGGYGNGGYGHAPTGGYKPPIHCQPPVYQPVPPVCYPPPCYPCPMPRNGGWNGQPKYDDPRYEEQQGQQRGQGDFEDRGDGGAVQRGGEEGQEDVYAGLPQLARPTVRKPAQPANGATLKKPTNPSNVPVNRANPIRRPK